MIRYQSRVEPISAPPLVDWGTVYTAAATLLLCGLLSLAIVAFGRIVLGVRA